MNPATQLDSKHQKMMDKLTAKTGSEFDTAYMTAMLKDHKTDIKAFQKEADKTENADLKSLVNDALPTLKEHLQLAESTAPKVGVKVEDNGKDKD
jgi:putative membrane protein